MILTCIYGGERWFESWKFRGFPQFLQIDRETVNLLANNPRPPVVKVVSSRSSRSIYLLIVSHIAAAVPVSSLHNLRIRHWMACSMCLQIHIIFAQILSL
jgi:hypothetical protein